MQKNRKTQLRYQTFALDIYNYLFDFERKRSAQVLETMFCVEGVSVQLPIFVLDKVSFSTSLAVFFETSHLIEQIVDMNRSTNCSRRPIFKAADEFLHHRTCFAERKSGV